MRALVAFAMMTLLIMATAHAEPEPEPEDVSVKTSFAKFTAESKLDPEKVKQLCAEPEYKDEDICKDQKPAS